MKQSDSAQPVPPLGPRLGSSTVGGGGGSFLDSGYIYAPYIPIVTTPSVLGAWPDLKRVPNSPLEDLVSGVYEEEIKAGELKPVRRSPADHRYEKISTRYTKKFVNLNYYSTVSVTSL